MAAPWGGAYLNSSATSYNTYLRYKIFDSSISQTGDTWTFPSSYAYIASSLYDISTSGYPRYYVDVGGTKIGEDWPMSTEQDFPSKTFNKTHSAQTVTVNVVYDGQIMGFSDSDLSSTEYVNINKTLTFNVSVPAKSSYSVSYNANGGGTTPASQTKWYGENLTLQGAITNRTNYVFKNWNTAANGSGTSYNAGATYTANAGATLYAQWYDPYTVSYDANGGTGAPSNQVKVYNTNLVLSSTVPVREGFRFMEWNTAADWSGTSYQPGSTYTANAALALHAIWWADPVVGTVTATRCDSEGEADELGGYVKVAFDWSITASQIGETQTAPTAFSVTVGQFSDTIVPSSTGGSYERIFGDGTLAPDTAYTVTATVQDAHGTTTSSVQLPVNQEYFAPRLAVACARVDANGNADVLGKYFKVTCNYAVYGTLPQSLALSFSDAQGHTPLDAVTITEFAASSGTLAHTFGPYGYDESAPYSETSGLFYSNDYLAAMLTDAFNSTSREGHVDSGPYVVPTVTSVTTYRTSAQTVEGVTTHVETDEGTDMRAEIGWTVLRTGTSKQDGPSRIDLSVSESETGTVVATRSFAYDPLAHSASTLVVDVYADPVLYPDDIVDEAGELFDVAKSYVVAATVYDLYTSAMQSSYWYPVYMEYGTRSDTLTPAFFTMDFLAGGHGIGIGGAATREMLDVHMPAQFDDPQRVSELYTLPIYFYLGNVPTESDIPVKPCVLVPLQPTANGIDGSYATAPSIWLCYDEPQYRLNVLGEGGWSDYQDNRTVTADGDVVQFIEWGLPEGTYQAVVSGADSLDLQAKVPSGGKLEVYAADSTSEVLHEVESTSYEDASVGYLFFAEHAVRLVYTAPEGSTDMATVKVSGDLHWEVHLGA